MVSVATAIVTNIEDPLGQGRVQLRFPWIQDEGQSSAWAPIAAPMAGNGRGQDFRPEVGDEALVAFDRGSFDDPYVVGFLWNGIDKPPLETSESSIRRIKTVAGHVLDFDDRPGQEKITLTTKGGQTLELVDAPARSTLKTSSGHSVEASDSSGGVVVKSASGVQISVTASGVTIQSSGPVSVTGPSVSVSSSSVTINAAAATFSGVVQCQTLVATAVVSSSYTPGVGNIW
ncbi:type IV secretion protein Rhs [bacterium]|nr:MAG: type IV secretion protein Rhs [bacterium]